MVFGSGCLSKESLCVWRRHSTLLSLGQCEDVGGNRVTDKEDGNENFVLNFQETMNMSI
jgi:hypothetical protein